LYLLNNTAIYFIPVVNIDGFVAIGNAWNTSNR